MQWRDFSPFVLPYVVGCPMPVLEHHARLMSVDWCRKTLCHTVDLDPTRTDGTAILCMEPLLQTEIIKVLSVAVAGRDWELVDPRKGQQHVRSEETRDYCFTQDNKTLAIHPVQAAGLDVVITAALMPSLQLSSGLADEVASQYMDNIAKGIVASIMRLPKQEYSDPAGSAVHQMMYEQRRSTVAAKVARGLSAAKMRNYMQFV